MTVLKKVGSSSLYMIDILDGILDADLTVFHEFS